MRDPTARFSDRVEHYVRSRPSYPRALLKKLAAEGFLRADDVVADVGCGTGKLSELLLERVRRVVGVEPNAEMRTAAERLLGDHAGFRSIDGRAEATTLPSRSVDLVAAGQAFHWFDRAAARREFRRILRAPPRVLLVWNDRRSDDAFGAAYEELLHRHGTDYREVDHQRIGEPELRELFGHREYRTLELPNEQRLELEGLRGRVLSTSYLPAAGEAGAADMLRDLGTLFEAHESSGTVTIRYRTCAYFGELRDD